MNSDTTRRPTYSEIMAEGPAHITLTLCSTQPIEVGDFVAAFTSLSSQYEKFIREEHPEVAGSAEIFVKEVRSGSIVADLFPFAQHMIPVITQMDQILIVDQFIRRYGGKLLTYLNGGQTDDASKSDLKDFFGQVAAIANDPNGSATIEAAYFEDKVRKQKGAIKFDTKQARRAQESIEAHKKQIELRSHADHERVLMVFEQSNTRDPKLGKRTGEWVRVESVLEGKSLPLIYASEMAEQRIKHEIREAPENVYKKGFVVDVNLEMSGPKPIAFRVTNFHHVIDLPDA